MGCDGKQEKYRAVYECVSNFLWERVEQKLRNEELKDIELTDCPDMPRADIAEKIGKEEGPDPDKIIKLHLEPKKLQSLEAVYQRMLISVKNRTGMGAIGSDEDVDELGDILREFSPQAVAEEGEDWGHLFDKLKEERAFDPDGKWANKDKPRNPWTTFAKACVSGARFLYEYSCFGQFEEFVCSFRGETIRVVELPLIIQSKVHGFGFTLACDFLKESGWTWYGKPDAHIKRILYTAQLIAEKRQDPSKINDIHAFIELERMAAACGKTMFAVDKVLWMAASGKLHRVQLKAKMLQLGSGSEQLDDAIRECLK